jgi:hypothetical protein
MRPFLNDERRQRLKRQLLNLNMPSTLATAVVFLPDQTQAVDLEMSWRCKHVIDVSEEIAKIRDSDISKLFELSTALSCDLLILGAFKHEALERGTMGGFAHWLEASRLLVLQ